MFKSLLGAAAGSLDSLILTIFIVLAVVLAGALVLYFLWEAVSSMSKKTKSGDKPLTFESTSKKQGQGQEQADLVVVDLDKLHETDEKEENEEVVVENEENAEQKEEPEKEEPVTEVDEEKAEEEKVQAESEMSEEDRINAERRAYLEARRQELIRRMQEEMANEGEEDEESETEEAEEESEQETEAVAEESTEEESAKEPEKEESVDQLAEERNALNAEKEKYEAMVKELEEAKKALAATQPAAEKPAATNGVLSLEELKARLEAAQERLIKTEKEFKQCKKEYIPLRKIWTAYERDQKKLRRKEALVARQKVLLYGVNNFADIDEEKAKKLSEDLDHLDGLKLSVQHCEEVMKENEERYPLLEKMYGVLSQRDEELKADIAYYKSEIAKLESEQEE